MLVIELAIETWLAACVCCAAAAAVSRTIPSAESRCSSQALIVSPPRSSSPSLCASRTKNDGGIPRAAIPSSPSRRGSSSSESCAVKTSRSAQTSAESSARWDSTTAQESLRRFSTKPMRNMIGTAHASPIVRGATS